ncbi:Ku protein [Zhengella mangrovi]|uniref:Non-homologous end joining protein Ku n=1 Tax=Zhengella mangrovi TaxID=1982044 RepID=A0A2G1QNW6_9HYPH|nr:Ku protein [Zhengella mangrovi]PHP67202.1 Ku protein [Zhengella mangrovi]
MVSRAIWKGHLRLSLVSIPVEVHSARKSGGRVSFRQIHEDTGKPVYYQKVVSGVGPVKQEDIVKGYEYEKDHYILLDPDEVDAIRLETKKTMDIVQFVGACEIPPLYYDKPYYLVPADELAEDAYRVLRDALRQTERVGLSQITMRGREHLVAIRPCGDGLLMETLHYADEIRNADPLFSSIEDEKSDEDLLDVAVALIDRKTAPFDAGAFHDNYAEALRDLVESKRKSRKRKRVSTEDEPGDGRGSDNVVDLMSALKQSLEKSGRRKNSGSGRKSETGSRSGKSSGRRKSG